MKKVFLVSVSLLSFAITHAMEQGKNPEKNTPSASVIPVALLPHSHRCMQSITNPNLYRQEAEKTRHSPKDTRQDHRLGWLFKQAFLNKES